MIWAEAKVATPNRTEAGKRIVVISSPSEHTVQATEPDSRVNSDCARAAAVGREESGDEKGTFQILQL